MVDLSLLLSASTIAVIGGGVWCESIIKAAQLIGYDGQIFPVHPGGKEIAGLQSYKTLSDWHGPIDAAFVGVNINAKISEAARFESALEAKYDSAGQFGVSSNWGVKFKF